MSYGNSQKVSLRNRLEILAKEKYPHYVNSGVFQIFAYNLGYLPSNASRRLREMESGKDSDGRPIRKSLMKNPEPKGRAAEYKWIPPLLPKEGLERARELSEMGVL